MWAFCWKTNKFKEFKQSLKKHQGGTYKTKIYWGIWVNLLSKNPKFLALRAFLEAIWYFRLLPPAPVGLQSHTTWDQCGFWVVHMLPQHIVPTRCRVTKANHVCRWGCRILFQQQQAAVAEEKRRTEKKTVVKSNIGYHAARDTLHHRLMDDVLKWFGWGTNGTCLRKSWILNVTQQLNSPSYLWLYM